MRHVALGIVPHQAASREPARLTSDASMLSMQKRSLMAEWTGLEPATPAVTGPIFICLFGVQHVST
jgi:hypothetical protein